MAEPDPAVETENTAVPIALTVADIGGRETMGGTPSGGLSEREAGSLVADPKTSVTVTV